MEQLMRMSAVEQARFIRTGEVSAAEMLEASINAIERLNPRINAVVLPLYERARASLAGATTARCVSIVRTSPESRVGDWGDDARALTPLWVEGLGHDETSDARRVGAFYVDASMIAGWILERV